MNRSCSPCLSKKWKRERERKNIDLGLGVVDGVIALHLNVEKERTKKMKVWCFCRNLLIVTHLSHPSHTRGGRRRLRRRSERELDGGERWRNPSIETREVGIESGRESENRERHERVEGDFKNNKKSSKIIFIYKNVTAFLSKAVVYQPT